MPPKGFYITTAIDYLNGPPHVGHAYEKIGADIMARFHRLRGEEVLFATGSDENAPKVVAAARAQGKSVQQWVDELRSRQGDPVLLQIHEHLIEDADLIRKSKVRSPDTFT